MDRTSPRRGIGSSPAAVLRRARAPRRAEYGRGGLFALAYGTVGTRIFLALGVVALWALAFAPVALLVAGLLVLAATTSMLEGASLLPDMGGSPALVARGFNRFAGTAAGLALAIAFTATAAVAALVAAGYMSAFWSPLRSSRSDEVVVALGVLALAAAANLRGWRDSRALRAFVVLVGAAAQIGLGIVGAALIFHPHLLTSGVQAGNAPSFGHLVVGAGVAVVAFADLEGVSRLAEEARDPERDLPAALAGAVGAVTLVEIGLALVALMAMPVTSHDGHGTTLLARSTGGGFLDAPLLGIVQQLPLRVVQTGLRDFVGLAAAAVLTVVAAHALRVLSRVGLVAAGGRPAVPVETGRSVSTAVIAAALLAAALLVAVAAVGARPVPALVAVAAFGTLFVLAAVQAAVVALRVRDPHRHRAYRVPASVWIGDSWIPLPAVAGALLAALLWIWLVFAAGPAAWIALAVSAAALAAYPLAAPRLGGWIARADAGAAEVAFRSILIPVPVDPDVQPADLLEVAAELVSEHRGTIVVLALSEIPLGEEMDMDLPELEDSLERLRRQARQVASAHAIRVLVTHLRTRDPVAAILEEADHRRVEMIMLSASSGRSGARLSARVARRVAAEAHSRVMFVQPAPVMA